ncbi:hypothetical protein QTO34_016798 [Cnephaeus nilssonii]|uniref:Uncharacterized protein n=1 Tax=Cnephaeus nilssonii TaxID=3371016 RepID=A0AA40LQM4_CNENI|nr:hypothetical protein QTO34_016798 [Eptesicus nilssonii]
MSFRTTFWTKAMVAVAEAEAVRGNQAQHCSTEVKSAFRLLGLSGFEVGGWWGLCGSGRCLKRGSDESVFSRGRHWIRTRTQSKGRLWPFSRRRHSESPTRAKEGPNLVKEEPQLVHEDPRPMPSREGPVSHTTEGQRRPEMHVATWESGEPGPMGAGRRTPPPEPHRPHQPPTSKPLSPNRRKALFTSVLQCCACGNRTRPEDLEPKEAEPKGEKHLPRGQTRLLL